MYDHTLKHTYKDIQHKHTQIAGLCNTWARLHSKASRQVAPTPLNKQAHCSGCSAMTHVHWKTCSRRCCTSRCVCVCAFLFVCVFYLCKGELRHTQITRHRHAHPLSRIQRIHAHTYHSRFTHTQHWSGLVRMPHQVDLQQNGTHSHASQQVQLPMRTTHSTLSFSQTGIQMPEQVRTCVHVCVCVHMR